ncbi:hypothetical protein BV898_10974 [Hypsibius exemplaris]|uniref:Dickkopf N-terminal cysteine-rich domain-containing protein n=1 Tax=Hypsibius exemplaris TaxID=2072580 RepID=A0A1W0WHY7_HYPEX|nr:hypothetical protein BV898_10974 [Hypsibius exemplaris]
MMNSGLAVLFTGVVIIGGACGNKTNPLLPPIEPAQQATAMRILTMNVDDMHYCEQDEDCTNPSKPLCHTMTRLCKASSEAGFDLIYGVCEVDGDCQPMYRCHGRTCVFSGPKACQSEGDCLTGHPGLVYKCKDLQRSAPGKRCWLKCNKDRDCHECDSQDVCRLPEEIQTKVTCCEGFCQRALACRSTPNA